MLSKTLTAIELWRGCSKRKMWYVSYGLWGKKTKKHHTKHLKSFRLTWSELKWLFQPVAWAVHWTKKIRPRRTPLLKQKHKKARLTSLQFFWYNVLLIEETIRALWSQCAWKWSPQNTLPRVKQGGSTIMLWAAPLVQETLVVLCWCFSFALLWKTQTPKWINICFVLEWS